ncbi:enoyl-CoA hydratase/carnithine racemase [Methylopila capsulata]|uniref:Enoyl-CoA hydratase n=1 Tax=Methylopila capsulata TaxID=61654 RepID=A0A9W6IQ82_9HYPH|nr:enoyl-CoA hydratase-related protein [Methylopila capsulata]MBM7851470.1 enoyl-CoA hydratase/carnithine racemase [Methylopila capsulata]GLK54527.1 enoyl-CoA hydratase [Methylopila capsulata]
MCGFSLKRDGAVGVLHLSSGRSSLTLDDLAALARLLEEAGREPQLRVLLFSGPAGTFCAGGDLADFLRCQDLDILEGVVRRFMRALAFADKTMIAAVDGAAIGLGMTMLLHFDLVFASSTSTFAAPFTDLGLIPEAGSTLLAPACLGRMKAFQVLCLGETLNAAEADRLGLAIKVDGDVSAQALDTARLLARKPAAALAATRRFLRGDLNTLSARIDAEIAHFRTQLEDAHTVRRLSRITRLAGAHRSAAA